MSKVQCPKCGRIYPNGDYWTNAIYQCLVCGTRFKVKQLEGGNENES